MNKFNIGETVHCFRKNDFDFIGTIYKLTDTGDGWEYWVTNAPNLCETQPILIWESEIERVE